MKAAVFRSAGAPLDIEDIELDVLGPRQTRIRMLATQVCRTDARVAAGDLSNGTDPTVLGHSGAGIVEAIGEAVTQVAVGDRVVISGSPECGECFWCASGRPDQCVQGFSPFNYVGATTEGVRYRAAANVGSYAQYTIVPEHHLTPTRTSLSDEQLGLIGCGLVCSYATVKNVAQVAQGDIVAIVGLGSFGLWTLQSVKLAGASRIFAIEPNAVRRELALSLGATDVIDPADTDPVQRIIDETEGRGADIAIETAGAPEAAETAFGATRRGGTVVITGMSEQAAAVTLPYIPLAVFAKTVKGSQGGIHSRSEDIPAVIRLLEEGKLITDPLVTSRYTLAEVNDALAASNALRDVSALVFPNP